MKLKSGLDTCTSDFWYDLKEGYLNPYKICANKEDAKRVKEAVKVLQEFEKSCEEQIEDFVQ